MSDIKAGDYVIVSDNSYCMYIGDKGLKKSVHPGGVHGEISPLYRVVCTDKVLPVDRLLSVNKRTKDDVVYNDTIIEAFNGETYLIMKDQLIKFKSKRYYQYIDRVVAEKKVKELDFKIVDTKARIPVEKEERFD